MRKSVLTFLVAGGVLAAVHAPAYTLAMPTGNLVGDPFFGLTLGVWTGSPDSGTLDGFPNAPGNFGAIVFPWVYQNIATTPGQQYAVSFYAADDQYWGPHVTIDLDLNNTVAAAFTTTLVPNVGSRFDEMVFQNFTTTFTATSSTTELEFMDADPGDFGLSGVSMVPVPAPEPATASLLICGGILALRLSRRTIQPGRGVWRIK